MPSAPEDGHKPLHRGGHGENVSGAALCGAAPSDVIRAALLRIAGVHGIPRLFLQPPFEVLPAPTGFVVQPALGDFDVFIGFLHHHIYVAAGTIVVVDQVAGADLIPAWAGDPLPGQSAEHGIGAEHRPARTVVAVAEWPVERIIGAIERTVNCARGIGLLQLRQGGLHTSFCGVERSRWDFLLVRLGAVDVDAVGSGIIGHAEVYRPADVPEPDVVAAADGVGGEGRLLAIDIECLAAGPGGEVVRCLGGGAAQGEASEDAEPHEDRFSFPVHDDSPFSFYCAFGKHNHAGGMLGSQAQ